MVEELLIRPLYVSEWEEAMRLAWDTFIIHEAPVYSKEGIKAFNHYYGEYYEELKKLCLFIENFVKNL